MPVIRQSPDLLNSYSEGDLAVMSIETHEEIAGCNELYKLIQAGIDDVKNGRTLTEAEVLSNMKAALG